MASIKGTANSDWLAGTAKDDVMDGYQGSDTLLGGAGNDDLFAGAYLSGGNWIPEPPAYNLLRGGAGDDTLGGGSGSDRLYGGPGNDLLYLYQDGPSMLHGGVGKDTLHWEDAAIRLDGGRGKDQLDLYSNDLDLRQVDNDKLVDIEVINMTLPRNDIDGDGKTLTLSRADVLAISSTTETLKVLGHGAYGDEVNIVGSYKDLGVSGRFHHYKLGAGMLLVETDVIVS